MLNVLDAGFIANLNDNDTGMLFWHGKDKIPHESNKQLSMMAQDFIVDSGRFEGRAYHL